jgi:hypothetical protein
VTDAPARPSSNTLREYGLLLATAFAGLAIYALFHALRVDGAASIAAYTALVIWMGLSCIGIRSVIADAETRRPDILHDGETSNYGWRRFEASRTPH